MESLLATTINYSLLATTINYSKYNNRSCYSLTFFSAVYARDIEFPQMNILIPSKTRRIPVPFHVTDDEIAEFNEHVIMTLKRHEDYTSLYRVKHRHNKVDISIEDNDGTLAMTGSFVI